MLFWFVFYVCVVDVHRFNVSKAPNFTSTPCKGLLQPMQSQNTVSEHMNTEYTFATARSILQTKNRAVNSIFDVALYCGAKMPIFKLNSKG